jgi:hypothetical protein
LLSRRLMFNQVANNRISIDAFRAYIRVGWKLGVTAAPSNPIYN